MSKDVWTLQEVLSALVEEGCAVTLDWLIRIRVWSLCIAFGEPGDSGYLHWSVRERQLSRVVTHCVYMLDAVRAAEAAQEVGDA